MNKKTTKQLVPLQKLVVEKVPIDSIRPNQYNANRQSDFDFELLCRSIEEDGFTQPVIVHRESREIVDGEHRWRAGKTLGWNEIDVVFVDYTLAQRMVATLRHNRARGSEDINMAADVLKQLEMMNAINYAQDSLMIDDVEMSIMLDDIPNAELTLRKPGEKLTTSDVENLIIKEKEFQQEKKARDLLQAKNDKDVWTIQLVVTWHEARIIEAALVAAASGKPEASLIVAREYIQGKQAEMT